MTDKLKGKVALITGASKGIGKGIARAFAGEGCSLVITSRSAEELQRAADEATALGIEVVTHVADVADEKQMQPAFDLATERFGRLDILVNNAGAFNGGPIDEMSLEDWDRVIATNLRGPFLCTQMAFRIMKPQGGGRVINIGSISGQRVRPRSSPYSTSKHGIWGLTQVTALEGREHGITCCCLHPGNILTERRDASDKNEDEEPMIGVDDISEVALLMATLGPNVEMLEAIVLPREQLYVGRG